MNTPRVAVSLSRHLALPLEAVYRGRRQSPIRIVERQPVPTMDAFVRLAKTATAAKPLLVLLQRGLTAVYVALRPDR